MFGFFNYSTILTSPINFRQLNPLYDASLFIEGNIFKCVLLGTIDLFSSVFYWVLSIYFQVFYWVLSIRILPSGFFLLDMFVYQQ